MRKVIFLVFITLISIQKAFSSVQIKVPEVVFPIEIIAEKREEIPPLEAPDVIQFKEKLKVEIFTQEIKPVPPYTVDPPVVNMEKPQAVLGIPEKNALLADGIESFFRGNYITAREKLEKLIKKYPKTGFSGTAHYLLGLIYYRMDNKKEAYRYFKGGCFHKYVFPQKDASCMSAAILSFQIEKTDETDQFLRRIKYEDINSMFLHAVNFVMKGSIDEGYNLLKDIDCTELDINFVEYCHYIKGYVNFSRKDYKQAEKDIQNVKDKIYTKHLLILKGFIKLNTGDLDKAEELFKKFLEGYGTVEKISDYVIYGLGIIDIKKGDLKGTFDKAGSLEPRNRRLAQNLYIQLADIYSEKNDFETAFALLQKSLQVSKLYKDFLRKKLAITAYNRGKYEYAYLIMKGIDSPEFYLYTGFTLMKMGKIPLSADYFEKAVDFSVSDDLKKKALIYLTYIYLKLNKDQKFLESVRKLKDLDPEYSKNMLGWFFFKKRNYQKAYEAFTDEYMKAVSAFNAGDLDKAYSLVKGKKDRKSRFLLAYIFMRKGDIDKARDILRELSKGDDKIAQQAGYLYAYSYFSEGKYIEAIKAFRDYAEKYRGTELGNLAVLRMADSYYNAGQKEKARKIYQQFIEEHANTPEAIDAAYQLTVLEMEESGADVASQIEKFIEKYPQYPFVSLLKLQLGDLYTEKQEYDKAEKIYRELIEADIKESEYALYKLGYLKYISGDKDQAVKILTRYIKIYPRGEFNVQAKELLAKIFEEQGDLDKAIAVMKKLPATDENKFKLAMLLYKAGRYTEAKSYFEEIYTRFPKYRADIAFYLGKIQFENGYFQNALRYLEEALNSSDYNNVAESYYLIGLIYEKLEDIENALNSFINVIYLYPDATEQVIKARLKVAEIMKKQGRRSEASCILKPINQDQLTEEQREVFQSLIKNLPECFE
ncbi:MAG TPA: tetratricopeptide repeat protein [Persephonella sp.]|uniref:Tetratricopeptide repeat domain protein n=1 Tax=Persephonella marina (strain DSM 14350 / EX-H1) TaxID=123214 RepID=C0QSS6_PERMH|nr:MULTISPECIES: tetratricopeptide repeat protein [Persephonella]ACO04138.1 tetratricopeptide repeat domain protein [Persephonella marina EX-H1]HCB70640.1 tetratricopeptide repeat protein [Persephonella sp.]